MTEANVHVLPTDVSIAEDIGTVVDDLRAVVRRNRDVVLTVGAVVGSILIHRVILRRELKRLHFSIEVFGDADLGGLNDFGD